MNEKGHVMPVLRSVTDLDRLCCSLVIISKNNTNMAIVVIHTSMMDIENMDQR